MNKLLSMGLLAACLVLATERPAQAWVNFKFSAGVNWHWQSGNNTLLWGAVRDGQVPGPEFFGGVGIPGPGPGPMLHQPGFPFFGNNQAPAATPNTNNASQQTHFNTIPTWYGNNVFQPASYQQYYSAPSYWYGR